MLRARAMSTAMIVLTTVLSVLAVMGIGAVLRRRGIVSEAAAAGMGRIVADVAFPALCLEGLAHAERSTLAEGAIVAVLGFVTLGIATLVGLALVRALGVPARARPTAVFAIAIGNWIFLPLPVAGALYGTAGTTTVLLNNVGAQIFLWTFGIVILKGRFDASAARAIGTSPGLWATLAGIALAVIAPPIPEGAAPIVAVLAGALHLVATLTIPLVSLAIGAQLADRASVVADGRAVTVVVLGRMVAAPLVVSALIELARPVLGLGDEARMTEHLIAAMPVSLSAAALVQRYDGDVALVSRAILVTTLLAAATAPLWMLAVAAFT